MVLDGRRDIQGMPIAPGGAQAAAVAEHHPRGPKGMIITRWQHGLATLPGYALRPKATHIGYRPRAIAHRPLTTSSAPPDTAGWGCPWLPRVG